MANQTHMTQRSAPYFDGNYDSIPKTVAGSVGRPITFEFWSYVAKKDSDHRGCAFGWESLLKQDSDPRRRSHCHALWHEGYLSWDYGRIDRGRLVADYAPYFDQWTHIALVSEGRGGKFQGVYINGELRASRERSDGSAVRLSELNIGRGPDPDSPGEYAYHRGSISGFQVWTGARRAEEIRWNHHATSSKSNILRLGEHLKSGQFLVSQNQNYFAILQTNGEFLICKGTGPAHQVGTMWSSRSTAPRGDYYAIMQNDGNFCVYQGEDPRRNEGYIWSARHQSLPKGEYFAVMQNDGNFCVYEGRDPEHQKGYVWSWMGDE